jgi:hypothetical protein
MNTPDETLSARPRIQVSVSADLLVLVRRIGSVTGESDPQVVLRGLLQSLPAMLGDVEGLRARLPEAVKPVSVQASVQPGKHGKR